MLAPRFAPIGSIRYGSLLAFLICAAPVSVSLPFLLLVGDARALSAGTAGLAETTGTNEADTDLAPAIGATATLARELVADGTLPGVSLALVSGGRVTWTGGFGLASLEDGRSTTPSTLYRVGSISKLFTALALEQLVEAGKLSLDRPLTELLPELHIVSPFPEPREPVRLWHLAAHLSGLPREPPVGSYLDGSGANPDDVLRSAIGLRLVHPPGQVAKYSNLAVSLLGSVIERVTGTPYATLQKERLLRPLGMLSSSFEREPFVREALAIGYMQEKDRSWNRAPEFELGTVAAGNLYSSVKDLARLALLIHGKGVLEGTRVLSAAALERMFDTSLPPASAGEAPRSRRFGVGFAVGERYGTRSVEHNGAVYGFSSLFVCLPELSLTAIILTNADVTFGPPRRLLEALLGGAVALRRGEAMPVETTEAPFDVGRFPASPRHFRAPAATATLRTEGGRPILEWQGYPIRLQRLRDDVYRTRDRLLDGNEVRLERSKDGSVSAVRLDALRLEAIDPRALPSPPEAWSLLEGDYGPPSFPVRVRVRWGRLVAECETFEYEPQPLEDGTFRFSSGDMYADEVLRFVRRGARGIDSATDTHSAQGPVTAALVGTMLLPKLRQGPDRSDGGAHLPLEHAHAHNDYEHARPLLDALDHGFLGVEADIYLVGMQLLVAHDIAEIKPDRTLEALYLEPLRERASRYGGCIYPGGPELTLLVDIKGEAEATYARLRDVLAQYAEIITEVRDGRVERRAVRVILSGNRPLETVRGEERRWVGLDGRMADLASAEPAHALPLISDRWGAHFEWKGEGPLPEGERRKLEDSVWAAHVRGRRIRFWATPDTPPVWAALHAAGVDLINTDDLPGLERWLRAQEP